MTRLRTAHFATPWAGLLGLTVVAWALPQVVMMAPFRTATYERADLWPWILLLGIVCGCALILVARQRLLSPFHPLVFAMWSYFAPIFLLGGSLYAAGGANHVDHALIPDPQSTLPLALCYTAVGVIALAIGTTASPTAGAGAWLRVRLPSTVWSSGDVLLPATVLVLFGIGLAFVTFALGVTGYQMKDSVGRFDAALVFLSFLARLGQFLLWFAIFRAERLTAGVVLAVTFLVLLLPVWLVLSGGRSILLTNWILMAAAFVLSTRRRTLANVTVIVAFGVASVAIGMLQGTVFRTLKWQSAETQVADTTSSQASRGERQVTLAEQLFLTIAAARELLGGNADGSRARLLIESMEARFDNLLPLAVLIGNHQQRRADEARYGLDHSIWTSLWTAVIPRAVWSGKPVIGDARAYSALYFGQGKTSHAVTAVGDLLRNFGPIGIPLGMALLGWILGVTYHALVIGSPGDAGRAGLYAMLLTTVSFEAFYGTIVPIFLRMLAVSLVGLLALQMIISWRRAGCRTG